MALELIIYDEPY